MKSTKENYVEAAISNQMFIDSIISNDLDCHLITDADSIVNVMYDKLAMQIAPSDAKRVAEAYLWRRNYYTPIN